MKIVLIGGGQIPNWNFETKDENQIKYETEKIDKEIVKMSKKKNPKLLFIGTAKKDNIIYYNAIKRVYENLGCEVDMLDTMSKDLHESYLEGKVLNTDIIYIGGGNTRYMLQRWKEINLDGIIKKAIDKNVVIAGFSAGAYAMCKYSYDLIQGLDIVPLILCVHYNEKNMEKKNMFMKNIKEKNIKGIALDNSTALIIENNMQRIIKNFEERKAYKVLYENGILKKVEI